MKPLAYFEARVEKDAATGYWNWKLVSLQARQRLAKAREVRECA